MKHVSLLAVVAAAVLMTLGVGVAFGKSPLEERVTKLEDKVMTLETNAAASESKIAALETKGAATESKVAALEAKLKGVTRTESGVAGKPTIQFSGVNVQVVNGEGKTATTNGEGNLVIGYDESPSQPPPEQTGSHNLILGEQQSFTSYGGILAGFDNTISGPFASVSGGALNTAGGEGASVSGGALNLAIGEGTSVSGGGFNTANGAGASVSGGAANQARGAFSSIFGGHLLEATGEFEAIP